MSTYLLAFIVGEYDFIEGHDADGVRIRVYTPVGKKEQGKYVGGRGWSRDVIHNVLYIKVCPWSSTEDSAILQRVFPSCLSSSKDWPYCYCGFCCWYVLWVYLSRRGHITLVVRGNGELGSGNIQGTCFTGWSREHISGDQAVCGTSSRWVLPYLVCNYI